MPESIDDAIAQMDRVIERSIETNDARGWFAIMYRGVTARVREGILAGEFDDPERMERFDVRFARYWLDAYEAWDVGRPVAASWVCSFEQALRPSLILQHLLLGMNAHINLDLGVAAAATCPGSEIEDLEGDFERINDVLAELVDQMQDAIALSSGVSRYLDLAGMRFDEALVTFSLQHARRRSWRFARHLAENGSAPEIVADRDLVVATYGTRIARPSAPVRWILPVARRTERTEMALVATRLDPHRG